MYILVIIIILLIFFFYRYNENTDEIEITEKKFKIEYDLNQNFIDYDKNKKKIYHDQNIHTKGIDNNVDRFINTKSEYDYNNKQLNQIINSSELQNKNIKEVYDNLITDFRKVNKKKEINQEKDNIIYYKDESILNGGLIDSKNNNELYGFDNIVNEYSNFTPLD